MSQKSLLSVTGSMKEGKSLKKMESQTGQEDEEARRTSSRMPIAVYIVSACLVMALVFLLVEMTVLLAMFSPKAFTMTDEVNVLLRNLNQVRSISFVSSPLRVLVLLLLQLVRRLQILPCCSVS